MGKRLDKFEKATEYVTKSTKLIILTIGSIAAIGVATIYGLKELGLIGEDEEEYYEEELTPEEEFDSTYYYGADYYGADIDSTYQEEVTDKK